MATQQSRIYTCRPDVDEFDDLAALMPYTERMKRLADNGEYSPAQAKARAFERKLLRTIDTGLRQLH